MASICQGKSKKEDFVHHENQNIYIRNIICDHTIYISHMCACMYIKYYTMITILYFENLKASFVFKKRAQERSNTTA